MNDKHQKPGNDHSEDELPKFLRERKGENPYAVPEGYFEQLPSQIIDKIESLKSEKDNTRHSFVRSMYPVSIAAAVAGLLMLFYFLLKPEEKKFNAEFLSENQITSDAIEEYLQDNANVDEEQIVEVMSNNTNYSPAIQTVEPLINGQDSIRKNNTKQIVMPEDTTITKDDIIQYLIDEDYDPEL